MNDEGERLGAAMRSATPSLKGVGIDDIVTGASAEPSRSALRPVLAGSVAILVLAAFVAYLAYGRDSTRAQPATSDYSSLVLHEGDTVRASGRVVAIPGRPVELCDPDVLTGGVGVVPPGMEPISACGDSGIAVTGVDLDRLDGRRSLRGAVTGTATVTGTYRNEAIAVTGQSATPLTTSRLSTNFHHAPCDPPSGGWPHGGQDGLHGLTEVESYARAHPGAIITDAFLQPTPSAAIAYVITAADPAPVRAALGKVYGARLCVVRSRYTQAQIDAASHAFDIRNTALRAAGATSIGRGGLGDDLQPDITVGVRQLTPDLARLAARQPAGLVHFDVWLTPRH